MTEVTIDFAGEQLASPWLAAAAVGTPTVMIVPTVMGVTELEYDVARRLNALGYNVMIADAFGVATRGAAREIMMGHLQRLKGNRSALLSRLQALLVSMLAQPGVDAGKVAVIGYCFGGMCALDLARSGADIAAVASFHGLFDPPGLPRQPIKARVAAYHGWDDPLVPPATVEALGKELTESGCDWQIHAYGHVGHGFTNPNAGKMSTPGIAYNELAAKRSWVSLTLLLEEVFG